MFFSQGWRRSLRWKVLRHVHIGTFSSFGSVVFGLAGAGCGSAGRAAVFTAGAAGADGGFGVAAGGAIGIAAVLAALAAA